MVSMKSRMLSSDFRIWTRGFPFLFVRIEYLLTILCIPILLIQYIISTEDCSSQVRMVCILLCTMEYCVTVQWLVFVLSYSGSSGVVNSIHVNWQHQIQCGWNHSIAVTQTLNLTALSITICQCILYIV